ncbi:MAG: NERD domain-containing protein [Chloroflexi bacterium]|nr:NERD domain-containing protein [Chloroflexota bacterium]MDA8189874.1 nuclease-related domain-containing protein [Dehalococcoidales bacterium]
MQVVTNEQFVTNRARIGKIGTLVGLLALLAGFFTSLNIELIALSYGLLILGLLGFNIGRYNTIRFGSRPRQHEILANSLKGLDQKYILLNYVKGVPASHLLLSPLGIFLIETRVHDGEINCEGDRCHRKRSFSTLIRGFVEGGLGSPSKDVRRGVEGVKAFLAEKLGAEMAEAVPVEGIVVFTNPLAQLKTVNPTVTVLTPKDLKAHIRSPQGRTKMLGEAYRKLCEVFEVDRARGQKKDK